MNEKNEILKLFPQPVFKFKVKDYDNINLNLLKYIYDLQKKDEKGVKKSNVNGWHSQPFDLSNPNEIPNKFFNSINVYIRSVFKSYGWLFDGAKIKCTSMWAIINKKNSFNIAPIC